MSFKKIIFDIIYYFFFLILCYMMMVVAQKGPAAPVYFLFLLICFSSLLKASIEHIIFIYIIFYPLGDILPVSGILIQGINLGEIISIMLILFYLKNYYKSKINFNKIEKLAVVLSFFFIVIYFGTFYFKSFIIYGMGGVSKTTFLIRFLKLVIQFLSIFIIIHSYNLSDRVKIWVKRGILFGFVFLGLNIYLTPLFYKLGLSIGNTPDDYIEGSLLASRSVGLFKDDANRFAHYMVVGFGYYLAIIEKKNKVNIFLILFIIICAIMVSGSRSGFVTLMLIIISFLFRQLYKKRLQEFILVIFSILIAYFLFGTTLERRLFNLESELGENIDQYNRIKYQLIYFNEIINNKSLLINGYWDKTQLYKSTGRWRNPHNQYMGMVFWGGIPYLISFLVILLKIIKMDQNLRASNSGISILYSFIGFCIMYALNPNDFIMYFPLILILSYDYLLFPKNKAKMQLLS